MVDTVFTEEAVNQAFERLPEGLCRRLGKIPAPERLSVLEEAGVLPERMGPDMEEEDVRSLDKAIRYKDARVQLVRMVLMTRIKNDLEDPEPAEELAAYIFDRHPLDAVHAAYEEHYQGKPLPVPVHA
ncbi:hypothetical protein LZ24_02308 [Desulfobotulus alkaliphilus]|uniref:Uncharacterized protein n=1 Tax=Desulfobotulus alkaliphilus TaxID=622671 RepID=A0A562RMK0_9BACT|nr:hypothetical protein [Desulfobotulus alkaliphilus]TWI70298.1 hypothetical protein LZ24_02308 [Desulfobotulus alkaliphilus]